MLFTISLGYLVTYCIFALSFQKDYTDSLQTNAISWAMRMTFIAIQTDFFLQNILSGNNY